MRISNIRIIVLFATTIAILAIQFSNAYAVDFADHTGYTPSWAESMGTYEALAKCDQIIGENTEDGNWCMDWVASVIDQGSTAPSQHPTTDMTERDCVVNVACIFPDEFLQYAGSYYDSLDHQYKSQAANVNFGQFVGNNKIDVSYTKTGYVPATGILDMNTIVVSNIQFHYPNNINSISDSNQSFGYVQSIPVNKSLERDGQLCSNDAGCKITYETMNIKGKTRTILIAHLDNYLGNGTFVENRYDNETGVWLSGVATHIEDGKTYADELHLVDSNIYDHPTVITISNAQSVGSSLSESQNSSLSSYQSSQELNNKSIQIQSSLSQPLNTSNTTDTEYLVLGLVTIVILPAIAIVLLVWKVKKYLAKRKASNLTKGI